MEWRARANSLEEKNRVLDEQLRRYVESYEAKKAALKEALESVDNETRLKEHFKQKVSRILPNREGCHLTFVTWLQELGGGGGWPAIKARPISLIAFHLRSSWR